MMRNQSAGRVFLIGALLLSCVALVSAQRSGSGVVPNRNTDAVDLNDYYRYPFSSAVHYQPLSGLGNKALADFSINEISGELRLPIPALPVLQLLLKGGLISLSYLKDITETNQDWTHSHAFLGPGLGYITRISREMEVGADFFAGASQSLFSKLVVEGNTVEMGQLNILAGVSGRLALNPSYNTSISINPALRYLYGLGELHTYDGFSFGVGFSVCYRFGQDPDAPLSVIRSLKFGQAKMPPVFAAMQSYYLKHPIGSITLTNIDKKPIRDVNVSFFQAGFMDSPTAVAGIDELQPGVSKEIGILASYNQSVFTTEGVTPLTGEVIVTYLSGNRPAEQRQSISYDLQDKTAISWDDDRKVAAFVTPADSALKNYASFIRQAVKDEILTGYCDPVQYAMQLFYALKEIGILYQPDPVMPFTKVQDNPMTIDSVSLPRETLKRITGDCDDLTALYASMLEVAGIESAFITVPGHIYAALNTKVPARNFASVHPERSMTIVVDGELWVPVEITMIGTSSFLDAWRKAGAEYAAQDASPDKRGFYPVRKSWELYRPVGLKETDLGLQYGNKEAITGNFTKEISKLMELIMSEAVSAAEKSGTKQAWNKLGISYARFGLYEEAANNFEKALELDPSYVFASINKGNILSARKEYALALAFFKDLDKTLKQKPAAGPMNEFAVCIALGETCYSLEDFNAAAEYFARAEKLIPDRAKGYSHLAQAAAGTGGNREAEVSSGMKLQYVEE
ncbi:MAG: tetratricopeptide repeat protein [Treponemataceae bacterium]